eukprot:TRINITY_DN4310_c0_g1_i2.p1 TRINITY_DN4310_c0_g1~~TRINITY_DN4310_c0_g1_i2.p1  ORF type:complete len:427 (+),score=57.34 TRINITY_DN4310_c0_g1_i2:64-1344(+)
MKPIDARLIEYIDFMELKYAELKKRTEETEKHMKQKYSELSKRAMDAERKVDELREKNVELEAQKRELMLEQSSYSPLQTRQNSQPSSAHSSPTNMKEPQKSQQFHNKGRTTFQTMSPTMSVGSFPSSVVPNSLPPPDYHNMHTSMKKPVPLQGGAFFKNENIIGPLRSELKYITMEDGNRASCSGDDRVISITEMNKQPTTVAFQFTVKRVRMFNSIIYVLGQFDIYELKDNIRNRVRVPLEITGLKKCFLDLHVTPLSKMYILMDREIIVLGANRDIVESRIAIDPLSRGIAIQVRKNYVVYTMRAQGERKGIVLYTYSFASGGSTRRYNLPCAMETDGQFVVHEDAAFVCCGTEVLRVDLNSADPAVNTLPLFNKQRLNLTDICYDASRDVIACSAKTMDAEVSRTYVYEVHAKQASFSMDDL